MNLVPFNLNDYVRVRLTERGLQIMNDEDARLCALYPKMRKPEPLKVDAEGYARFQLWALMQQFGPHIGLAIRSPFETEILIEARE